ncbi:MAG: isochorismatase [Anaerolineales bacterium]
MGLPIPQFYRPERVGEVWRVPYEERARDARGWAKDFGLRPAAQDAFKVWLLLVDVQNTFCIPDFELFVAGRSGQGAVEDNRRLVEFIYRNLDLITQISATMDTHQAMQIFHALFLVDAEGNPPAPYTQVTYDDVQAGRWRFNPVLAAHFGITAEDGQELLRHYTHELAARRKYTLTIWPYHAMLGGIGHALVSAVEEAIFFHTVARLSQPYFEIKGNRPFTENYSVIGPEVERGPRGEPLGERNPRFLQMLKEMDMLIIAGQAKSHCVAWTVEDLLRDIQATDPALADKVYLLEDCTSPVVVPTIDYTEEAEAAFARFAAAGMHRVRSTDDEQWLRARSMEESR